MKKLLLAGAPVVLLGSLLMTKGCGDDARSTDQSYQGLGSIWTASFTSGSNFTITYDSDADGTADMEVNGTYVEYSNQFRKLTVTSASGTGAPNAGEEAYGLEIPGFAFFLKPIGSGSSEPIVMVSSGSCPTSNFESNWIIAKYQDAGTPNANTDGFGSASFVVSGSNATGTIDTWKFSDGTDIDDGSSNSITFQNCSNGTYTWDEGGGETGVFMATSNGGALVEPNGGIIFAAPQLNSTVTSSDWDGTYSGLVFAENDPDGTFPARVTLSGNGGTGVEITDVENNTVESNGATFANLAGNSSLPGVIRGTVELGSGAQPLNCVYSSVAGEELLACNGAEGALSGSYPMFFFLGVKQ